MKRKEIIWAFLFIGLFLFQSTAFAEEPKEVPIEKNQVDFIDISSHNGSMSEKEFKILKKNGVKGVVVKVSEGTLMENGKFYVNPLARKQITEAKKAGLAVSVYHYAKFSNAKSAKEEAELFIQEVRKLGLSEDTLLVNDMEDSYTLTNEDNKKRNTRQEITNNMLLFQNTLNSAGFSYVVHYTYENFLRNNLDGTRLGKASLWMANYLHTTESDKYKENLAWQWTSSGHVEEDIVPEDATTSRFDFNVDYSGIFTNNLPKVKASYISKNPSEVVAQKEISSYWDIHLTGKKSKTYKQGEKIEVAAIQMQVDGTPTLLLKDGSYLSANLQDVLPPVAHIQKMAKEKRKNILLEEVKREMAEETGEQGVLKMLKSPIVTIENEIPTREVKILPGGISEVIGEVKEEKIVK
ncbi:Glycosyl hydrolases family 25 [Pilibacter termitis]|uniref:Glycosyl hydrolases family 25 n=1 Tax=Pilibacter termitis TaxID=263852 RepID=A0A1T4Q4G4_9ENTE|nr:GH25 family lysozyme [Pilibacter termitis]SJZ98554.1 Glycosyl hydrolases family 25 [Pilibacter termitis]